MNPEENLELKNTIDMQKNAAESLNSRKDQAEERMSKLVGRPRRVDHEIKRSRPSWSAR